MSAIGTWEAVMQAEELPLPQQALRPSQALARASRPLLIRREDAARYLGMSVDSLERHVLPEIKTVRVGRMVLLPVAELEAWVAGRAARQGHGW